MVIPMVYAPSLQGIRDDLARTRDRLADTPALLAAGLASPKQHADAYGGPDRPPLVDQIREARAVGVRHFAVFSYGWLMDSPGTLEALRNGAFARPARAPGRTRN